MMKPVRSGEWTEGVKKQHNFGGRHIGSDRASDSGLGKNRIGSPCSIDSVHQYPRMLANVGMRWRGGRKARDTHSVALTLVLSEPGRK